MPFRNRGIGLENSVELLGEHNVVIAEQRDKNDLDCFCQILTKDRKKLLQLKDKLKKLGFEIKQDYNPKTHPDVMIISVCGNHSDVLDVLS